MVIYNIMVHKYFHVAVIYGNHQFIPKIADPYNSVV